MTNLVALPTPKATVPAEVDDLERLARQHGLTVFYVQQFDRCALLARQSRLLFVADDLSGPEAADAATDLSRMLLRRPLNASQREGRPK